MSCWPLKWVQHRGQLHHTRAHQMAMPAARYHNHFCPRSRGAPPPLVEVGYPRSAATSWPPLWSGGAPSELLLVPPPHRFAWVGCVQAVSAVFSLVCQLSPATQSASILPFDGLAGLFAEPRSPTGGPILCHVIPQSSQRGQPRFVVSNGCSTCGVMFQLGRAH